LAEESSRINENAKRWIQPFATNADYWNLDIPSMANQSLQFGYQNAPQLNQFNMQQLQGLLNTALPGYQNIVNQMAGNTQSLLSGNVPTDVQQAIQRSAAYQSLVGGTAGAGTGTSGAITARDLGLTSLGLQQQGYQQGANLLQLTRNYLTPQPVNPTSLLPLNDLIAGQQWSKSALFSANEKMFQAQSAAATAQAGGAPNVNLAGSVGGDISGLLAALGQKNPSGQTGYQQIGGLFGGLFGGGSTGGQSASDYATMTSDITGSTGQGFADLLESF